MGKQRVIPLTSPLILFVVHHSAARDEYSNIQDLIAERKRRNEGYNIVVDDDGDPDDGRAEWAQDAPDTEVSNGTYGINERAVNFSIDGNLELRPPTIDEYKTLVQVMAAKAKRFGWRKVDALGDLRTRKPSRIITHQEAGLKYSSAKYRTACPGRFMIALMGELRRDVAGYLPA
jgi:hypothetical protein